MNEISQKYAKLKSNYEKLKKKKKRFRKYVL